tara:strand:- start:838 stop:1083 length:246 start_codon:yes stop_codon:yes gene_type:complete
MDDAPYYIALFSVTSFIIGVLGGIYLVCAYQLVAERKARRKLIEEMEARNEAIAEDFMKPPSDPADWWKPDGYDDEWGMGA